MTVHVNI